MRTRLDVGGGYGPRMAMYPEFLFVVWAAKRLGRPVKWTGTRSEAFVSDHQARDQAARSALAFDADGRILAMRGEILYNVDGMTHRSRHRSRHRYWWPRRPPPSDRRAI